jgi:hypothetical protein
MCLYAQNTSVESLSVIVHAYRKATVAQVLRSVRDVPRPQQCTCRTCNAMLFRYTRCR